jgi:cytochrome c oxidase accessory protein FixG
VWTYLFQHVDRLIDGDRNAQVRLANAPLSLHKFSRRALKYSIYLFIAFWTGGAWIMYFADAPTLVVDFWSGQANPIAYTTVAILTATTFVLGGFMREQVCIYMCPWPRIQTAMMDEKSLLVTYKDWRGERRGSLKTAEKNPGVFGDCVDCNQCVAVCPTGIDIREGPQIGCITCALCIDACDAVMAQTGKPRGLIDYCTLDDAAVEKKGGTPNPAIRNLLRPRTMIYFGLWASIGLLMLFSLGQRTRLELSVQHDRNPVYVQLSDGMVRNNYILKIRNMEARPRRVEVSIDGLRNAEIWSSGGVRTTGAQALSAHIDADSVAKIRVFVAASGTGATRQDFAFIIKDSEFTEQTDIDDAVFERPETDQ